MMNRTLLAFLLLAIMLFATLPSYTVAQEGDDDDGVDAGESSKAGTPTPVEGDEYDEDTEEVVEEEPQMYVMPAQDVQTYVKFLGVNENKFIAGNEVTALIGMINHGDKTYNVSYVGAHLHSPYDFNFYVQNFSVGFTSSLLPPHSEVTINYRFRPDEKLEPLDFHLSGWLIYNDSAVPTQIIYRSLFVNQTIEVLERKQEWTVQSAITWSFSGIGMLVVSYVAMQYWGGLSGSRKRSVTRGEGGAAAGWEAKVYKPAAVQKAVSKKR